MKPDTIHSALVSMLLGPDWELAMDILDSQGLDLNGHLAVAKEGLSMAGREREWRIWLLKRRQGTEDYYWYGQGAQGRSIYVHTGWAGMQLFDQAVQNMVCQK